MSVNVSNIPFSISFRTNQNARLTFATHFSSLNTYSRLSMSKEISKDDMAKFKILCFPFHSPFQYLSRSVCKTPILLSNYDHQHLPLCPPHQFCSLQTQFILHAECFCVVVKHKSRENPHDILYTCVFWMSWNTVFLGDMIIQIILGQFWKVGTSGTIQVSSWTSLFRTYNIIPCCFGSTNFTCNFFFSYTGRHFFNKQNNLKIDVTVLAIWM